MKMLLDKKGMTLLELMVVVAIIGITATIAIPNYLKMLPHLRLKSAARDVASAMQHARMTALSKNHDQNLGFNVNTDSFVYQEVNTNDWRDVDMYEESSAGVTGTGVNAVPSLPRTVNDLKVKFKPDGTTDVPAGNTYALYMQNKSDVSKKYRVTVNNLGIIKIQQYNGISWSE